MDTLRLRERIIKVTKEEWHHSSLVYTVFCVTKNNTWWLKPCYECGITKMILKIRLHIVSLTLIIWLFHVMKIYRIWRDTPENEDKGMCYNFWYSAETLPALWLGTFQWQFFHNHSSLVDNFVIKVDWRDNHTIMHMTLELSQHTEFGMECWIITEQIYLICMDKTLVKYSPVQMSTKGDISPFACSRYVLTNMGEVILQGRYCELCELSWECDLKTALKLVWYWFLRYITKSWGNSSVLAWSVCRQ